MSKKPSAPRTKRNEDISDIVEGFNKNLLSSLKLDLKHKNENQKKLTQAIKKNDLTICSGPPGCGKTYLSCYESLLEIKHNDKINKIVLVKSVVTLKSEEIGFLKGTLEEKMEPFMFSFMKNFEKIIGAQNSEKLKQEKIIEILPIAYMRGINIDNAIIIIDETQNITIDNIRTILTRLGENSKMIFLGDTKQIDQKNKNDSALKFLIANFKNIEGVGVVEFGIDDIVRHPLIKKIEPIFENLEAERLAKQAVTYAKPPKEEAKPSAFQKFMNLIF